MYEQEILAALDARGVAFPFATRPHFKPRSQLGSDSAVVNEVLAFMSHSPHAAEVRRPNMASDAALSTIVGGGIPWFLANYLDPTVIEVLFSPMRATEIYGEARMGQWDTQTTLFPLIEHVGEVSSYGDYNANGSTGMNPNWVTRQSYLFQTITRWGELQQQRYALAGLDYVNQQNKASMLVLNKFHNFAYFFGINGMPNYGGLNDPSLLPPVVPSVKATGNYNWGPANGGATAMEIYNDCLYLFTTLQKQMGGLIEMTDAFTLAVSTTIAPNLNKLTNFNVSVRAMLRENFPNMEIKTAPEFTTASGELAQLILKTVDGQPTTMASFNEKMRAHAVVPSLSSWQQKKTGGVWGTIIRYPEAISQMIGL